MKILRYVFGFLILATVVVWTAAFAYPDRNLHLVACDVGQGDAILASYGNVQILTDGGPDRRVLDCLSKHIPFWDREIELIVLTHPQKDHYEGLIDVFKRYKVDNFIANRLEASSPDYQVLKREVGGQGTRVTNPTGGTVVRFGLMHLDIFWPSKNFLDSELSSKRDPNDFSIQSILSLGDFDVLLTGDIGHNMADEVLAQFALSGSRRVEYIKIPHHGSKYGMTPDYLGVIEPKVAVISSGKNNRYGHPHEETLKILREKDIKILRTDEKGDIEVITDGKKWWKH